MIVTDRQTDGKSCRYCGHACGRFNMRHGVQQRTVRHRIVPLAALSGSVSVGRHVSL